GERRDGEAPPQDGVELDGGGCLPGIKVRAGREPEVEGVLRDETERFAGVREDPSDGLLFGVFDVGELTHLREAAAFGWVDPRAGAIDGVVVGAVGMKNGWARVDGIGPVRAIAIGDVEVDADHVSSPDEFSESEPVAQ